MMGVHVPDRRILEAVEAAIDAGDTDMGGGAPPPAIARRCNLTTETVRDRVADLVDDGDLRREWGVGPQGPRYSYRPA